MLWGNGKVTATVVGGTVEDQQDVLPGKLARQHVKEDLEACRIRSRHDQVEASAHSIGSSCESRTLAPDYRPRIPIQAVMEAVSALAI